ncbi:pyrroloquinoline-quinone synthase PqqC [Rickettsiales bacterium]|nr:pyrroloquinoline-quinone synthase PqqC [Rickettsiales bacterium]
MKNLDMKYEVENQKSPWTHKEFEEQLREIGRKRYHDNCRFHHLLHSGMLNKGQVQAWSINRYYYQINISIKDSALMSRIKDPELRRKWIHRILDHDGRKDDEGGIERWYKLTDGLDLDRDYVKSTDGILPATRFAVDAYVSFVKEKSLLEGVTSSLTELFAPKIHKERISGMLENYNFINDTTMAYFKKRVDQATDDADFVLNYALKNALTREQQESVCNALKFKTDVLWVMQDALYQAYVYGSIPPGSFIPKDFDDRYIDNK